MVRSGASKDEISKVLTADYHWAAGGLAIQPSGRDDRGIEVSLNRARP